MGAEVEEEVSIVIGREQGMFGRDWTVNIKQKMVDKSRDDSLSFEDVVMQRNELAGAIQKAFKDLLTMNCYIKCDINF